MGARSAAQSAYRESSAARRYIQLYIGIVRDPTLQKVKWVVSECSLGHTHHFHKMFSAPLRSDRPTILGMGVAAKLLALGRKSNASNKQTTNKQTLLVAVCASFV